jgi:hypothetical protein
MLKRAAAREILVTHSPFMFADALDLLHSATKLKMKFEPIRDEEKEHTWVTLVRAGTLVEADEIATRLQAMDIPVFIPDEFSTQTFSINANGGPAVRVQVPPSKYELARDILSATPLPEPGAEGQSNP